MKHLKWILGTAITVLISTKGLAQAKAAAVPDAQIESDVLKALAGNPKLADQTITSDTVYGTVTLSGSVRNEESRKLAETIVSETPGVQKVIDELTVGTEANASSQPIQPAAPAADCNGSNPLLQSDGTMAPPPSQTASSQPDARAPQAQQRTPAVGQPRQQTEQRPQDAQQQAPYDRQPNGRSGPDQSGNQSDGGYQAQQPPTGPYGPPFRRPYRQPPYGRPGPPPPYQTPYPGQTSYGAQQGGQPVTVSSGSVLRVRVNQEFDSKHTPPGTVFDAVVLNDVVGNGFVAIPRGATVRGAVVDTQTVGTLRGRGELALRLTEVELAGKIYPIASDVWSNHGVDKTARTVNSAVALGAAGAILGGVAGGGAGAAVGAGVGGAAGVGASAASGSGQAYIPSEAILTFHLTQQTTLDTVSQQEMDRLGYGVAAGAQMRQRYAQPVPYPYPVYPRRYPYPY